MFTVSGDNGVIKVNHEIITTLESKLQDVRKLRKKFSNPDTLRTEEERSAWLRGMESGIEYVLSTIKGGK